MSSTGSMFTVLNEKHHHASRGAVQDCSAKTHRCISPHPQFSPTKSWKNCVKETEVATTLHAYTTSYKRLGHVDQTKNEIKYVPVQPRHGRRHQRWVARKSTLMSQDIIRQYRVYSRRTSCQTVENEVKGNGPLFKQADQV